LHLLRKYNNGKSFLPLFLSPGHLKKTFFILQKSPK
jgi:hypothetical protein